MIKKVFFQLVFFSILYVNKVFAAESGGMPQLNPEFWVSQIFWLTITFGILYIVLSKLILPKISFDKTIYKIPKVSVSQKICEIQNSGFN